MTARPALDLVSFHAAPPPGSAAAAIDALLPGPRQLALSRASFERHHRLRRHVVLTDATTALGGMEAFRGPVRHGPTFMLDALRLQRDFLAAADHAVPMVFCDPDILFLRPVDGVFDSTFDLAFTRRAHRVMPFNSGIFFLSAGRKAEVVAFWTLQVEIVETMLMAQAGWFADQLVLNEIVARAERLAGDDHRIGPVRFRLLDAARYNYTPHRDHPYLFRVPGASVYHFKGRCRTFMEPFFRYHVASRGAWVRRLPAFLRDCVALERAHHRLKAVFQADGKRIIRTG